MNQLIKLSISDFKLVFRDPSLRIFLFLPLLIFLIILVALPYLMDQFTIINDYVPYILMGVVTQVSTMFGFIYGIVLIDEKDTQVAKVYGVLPVSKSAYVLSRLVVPFVLSSLLTWLILLIQPFYSLAAGPSLLLSMLVGLMFPVYVLGVSILSKNKMIGLTWVKIFNLVIIIPVLAFFIPNNFSPLFGIFPTHWLFQGLNNMILAEGPFGLNILIGYVFSIGLLLWLTRRFSKTHFV